MSEPARVVAVVPTFNPDAGFPARATALLRQVEMLIVVDDGSSGSREWETHLAAVPSLVLVRQENRGIAAAINHGIELARDRCPELDFVLTVDQDSTLGEAYVQNATSTFARARDAGIPVGAICAGQFNDWQVTPRHSRDGFQATLEVAQSGLLIPATTLRDIGVFNEGFFIDCVDTEYALRMMRSGLWVVVGDACQMSHEVGTVLNLEILGRAISIRGKTLKFSYHSALRRYYISRNRVIMYRRYFWSDPIWNTRETIFETRTTLLSILFGPKKLNQALAVVLGIVDGAAGVAGKAPGRRRRAFGSAA